MACATSALMSPKPAEPFGPPEYVYSASPHRDLEELAKILHGRHMTLTRCQSACHSIVTASIVAAGAIAVGNAAVFLLLPWQTLANPGTLRQSA